METVVNGGFREAYIEIVSHYDLDAICFYDSKLSTFSSSSQRENFNNPWYVQNLHIPRIMVVEKVLSIVQKLPFITWM